MDLFSEIILFLVKDFFIIPFLITGYFLCNRRYFFETTCLLMVTMTLNTYLKSLFKFPLPPGISSHAIYGFPSGHMIMAIVLWGWLAIRSKNLLFRFVTVILLCTIGYALIHKGYHYPFHIYGAFGFGSLMLICAQVTLPQTSDKNLPLISLVYTVIVAILLYFTPYIPTKHWMAPAVLISGSISWWLLKIPEGSIKTRILGLCFSFSGIAIIYFGMNSLKTFLTPINWTLISFCIITFWSLYASPTLASRFLR